MTWMEYFKITELVNSAQTNATFSLDPTQGRKVTSPTHV